MTSPCDAVLTSSPTITFTPYSAAFAGGLERAGDLVVVGDGDRAEPLAARGREQHLDRRRAVVRVVGVHVQVDVDELAPGEPPADRRRRPSASWRRAASSA